MKEIAGLDYRIQEMAGRIRELREIMNLSCAQMAQKTGVTEEEYRQCESGNGDLNFAFLYRCALAFNVDVVEIIEGTGPKLRSYCVTRKGEGQLVDKAHGMEYFNLGASFQNRIAEPLYVNCTYRPDATDIELTSHEGQECDIVLKGALKVQVGSHIELLHEGDAIYYDSNTPHGMIAAEGADCIFYAIVLTPGQNSTTTLEQAEQSDAPIRRSMKTASCRVWSLKTTTSSTLLLTLSTVWRKKIRTSWPCFISPATNRSAASLSGTCPLLPTR